MRNFKEFFWRWIGSSEPALAHHEVCFGQMGKVGRSSPCHHRQRDF